MWGRLAACGRVALGLLLRSTGPARRSKSSPQLIRGLAALVCRLYFAKFPSKPKAGVDRLMCKFRRGNGQRIVVEVPGKTGKQRHHDRECPPDIRAASVPRCFRGMIDDQVLDWRFPRFHPQSESSRRGSGCSSVTRPRSAEIQHDAVNIPQGPSCPLRAGPPTARAGAPRFASRTSCTPTRRLSTDGTLVRLRHPPA